MTGTRRILVAWTAAVVLMGCGVQKSANPLSPTVAGPLPGVSITTPRTVAPVAGARILPSQQPVTLTFDNATTSGVRPISYAIEIATDVNFAAVAVTRQGVPQGGNGRTSLVLAQPLPAGRTYYWRVRAEDGANAGAFTPPSFFEIVAQGVIGVPTPLLPVNGQTTTSLTPRLVVQNAARSGAVGPISYIVTINLSSDFAATTAAGVWAFPEQPDRSAFDLPASVLLSGRRYYWVVRAADGQITGDWSAVQSFVTPPATPAPVTSP